MIDPRTDTEYEDAQADAQSMFESMGAEAFDYDAPQGLDGIGESFKGLLRQSAGAGRTLMMAGAVVPIAQDKVLSAIGGKETRRQQQSYFGLVDDYGSDAVDAWTPDPVTMGSTAKAVNMVSNVVGSVPLMIGAPALFLANSGIDPATELSRQGVDTETALAVGGVNLAVNAIGMRLPAAFGTNLGTRLATGAGSNAVLGVAADAASAGALDAGGFGEQAQGYEITDPYARGLDVLMGLAFGAKAHIDAPRLTPGQRDAVLVANNAAHIERDTMPGTPLTPRAEIQHQTALSKAIRQVMADERVNIADSINFADFLLKPELQTPVQRALSNGYEAVQADFRSIAEANGAVITSMERGVIARGAGARSQHPHGTAADFRTKGRTPEQTEKLMADLRAAGFEVIDERNTDQPHIHAELPPGGRRAQNIANAAKETSPAGEALRTRLVDNPEQLATDYAALKDSEGGVVLNTDVARELSPEYLADRTRSADVHEAASDFIKTMYERKLAEPTPAGRDNVVLFTAGGTGAGKTTALTAMGEGRGSPEIIYDTNMNTLGSAVQKVEQALTAGRDVQIAYVYRDPVEALTAGALPRAERQAKEFGSGRTVPLAEHAKTHTGVRPVMEALAAKYADDPRVRIMAIDNSRGKGGQKMVPLEEIPLVEQNRLHERLSEALESARAAGLSESIYRGFSEPGREAQPALAGNRSRDQSSARDAESRNRSEAGEVIPPELDAAAHLAASLPQLEITLDDGTVATAADALARADAGIAQAQTDATGFAAAVSCMMRFS